MNIPFHKPILPKTLELINTKSIKNGWLTTGSQVKKFEGELSNYLNAKYVVAVNSCTAALHLALAAKGFNKGDKFIVPTYTFVASVEVGEYLGMEPVFVDCDDNFNIDIDHIDEIVRKNDKIKAIIPVHFAGRPVDMVNIFEISENKGIFVLEDAAHALESESNIGKVGDTNHACAFSFYANKNITTAGEGGAVATNNKKLAEKIRKLSLHGMSKDGWNRFKTGAKWEYDVSELGYKYNMTDIASAFGKWQMAYVNEWHKKREKIVGLYQKNFEKINGIICPKPTKLKERHGYHLYVIRVVPEKWKIGRNKIIEKLNESGIGTSVHYKPVHMQSYYQKKYGHDITDFPNAKNIFDNVITLPLYPSLSNKELNYICETLKQIWNYYRC